REAAADDRIAAAGRGPFRTPGAPVVGAGPGGGTGEAGGRAAVRARARARPRDLGSVRTPTGASSGTIARRTTRENGVCEVTPAKMRSVVATRRFATGRRSAS